MKTKTTLIKVTILFIALLLMSFNAFSQGGTLDTTFDTDGQVTTSFSTSDNANSVAIQTDGKIVVAGVMSGTTTLDFAVARYNTNGSLDTTFDTDGKVTTAIGISDDIGYSVAIQTDGKIVVAGASRNSNISVDFAVVRYNINGSLDTTFGTNGKVTTDIGGDDFANSVAIQADGKIVLAGFSGNPRVFSVVRYNANGSLDTTFDTDGKVMTSIGNDEDDKGYSVAIQTDGKIVVVGSSSFQTVNSIAVVRYNTDGSLDTTFSLDGRTTLNSDRIGYSVAIQTDGKIVIVAEDAVVRCNPNGSPDDTFGVNGLAIINTSTSLIFRSIAIQTDGKIVVTGNSGLAGALATARLNTNGSNDATFGTNGVVTTVVYAGSLNVGNSVAIQSDGKIVVAGTVNSHFAVVRYYKIPIPVVEFAANDRTILVGGSVNFTDLSPNTPTSWNWTFPGATTTSSTLQNPTNITYNAAGTYAVTLTATNAGGSNTLTKTAYINVNNTNVSCNKLFFSEYIEGTNNNRAIEIYNPTSNSIDLASYSIEIYTDASLIVPTYTLNLSGTIYGTYVIAKSGAAAEILSSADLISSSLNFNGYNAIVLKKGFEVVDVIGVQGTNPTTPWTVGTGSTLDHTLVRKANVTEPSDDWLNVQNQWTVLPVDTITNLGQHTCNCSNASSVPVVAFTANVTTIPVGGSVNFTDLSTNSPSSWNWTFNGAVTTSSTAQNPTNITYNTVGCYAVTLTATNAIGNGTLTQTCYINVTNAPLGCNELFFSEYLEGTANSKALEIYNPSNNAIDLAPYSVVLYANGVTTATNTQVLSGSIAAHGTYVLANSAAVAGILSIANLTSNVCSFNGDDALVLKNGSTIIDVIGEVGVDPGLSWAVGSGSTLDYTLVRNANVDKPSNSWTTVQNQWTVNPVNTFSNLGQHTSNCNTLAVATIDIEDAILVYPNPASTEITISTTNQIEMSAITITDLNGRIVKQSKFDNVSTIQMNIVNLQKGMYLMRIETVKGICLKKVIID